MNAFSAMMRNGNMIKSAEKTLNDAIAAGQYVAVENPDGTVVRLQHGFKIRNVEMIITTENGCEAYDFNHKKEK